MLQNIFSVQAQTITTTTLTQVSITSHIERCNSLLSLNIWPSTSKNIFPTTSRLIFIKRHPGNIVSFLFKNQKWIICLNSNAVSSFYDLCIQIPSKFVLFFILQNKSLLHSNLHNVCPHCGMDGEVSDPTSHNPCVVIPVTIVILLVGSLEVTKSCRWSTLK